MKPINEMNLQECLGSIRKGNYLGRYILTDRIVQLNQEQSKRNEELLEALKDLLDAVEYGAMGQENIEKARQAIAKAEGK